MLNFLCIGGTQRFINTLGKIFLEPGEKIEAFRDERILRIVSTRSKINLVLNALDEQLQCVKTKSFPLTLVGNIDVDEVTQEELGRITNSRVQVNRLRKVRPTPLYLSSILLSVPHTNCSHHRSMSLILTSSHDVIVVSSASRTCLTSSTAFFAPLQTLRKPHPACSPPLNRRPVQADSL